jgi:DNA-binding CsgD family transcriptional regulator/tetratricopeptide (TPR) repeat protein
MTMDLLERNPQLEELARHLRAARSGAGKIVFICGEAGAGKSVLVEQFTRQSHGDVPVLWGHCDALQTSRVLGPVSEVVTGLALLPDAPLQPTVAREMLFPWLLERLSPPNPLSIVVLEDLHWADEATLDFLQFIGRRIQRTRCLLIATYRDDELPPIHLLRGVLGGLTGQHVGRIRLSPLSVQAVERLADGTGRCVRQIYNVTGGNPFFVRELLSAPGESVPETVRDAVLGRLSQCSSDARELAELVSLLPGRTEPWLIRSLLGDFGLAADEAVMRGLLRYYESGLAYRHELGRLAVEGSISRARTEILHRGILQNLVDRSADLSQFVHHASRAQDVKAILKYAPEAARQAAGAGAHREAVAHLTTALQFADSLTALERARLLDFHAVECDTTNEVAASISSASRALALWREANDINAQARALLLLSRQYWKSGQKECADRYVTEAIDLLEGLPAGPDIAMAYSTRSQRAMTCGFLDQALEFGERALALAGQFDDNKVRSHALNNIGTALLQTGDSSGVGKLEHSLSIALGHNLQEHAARAYANLVCIAVRHFERDRACRYILEGLEYCELYEVHDCLAYIRAFGAQYDLSAGSWDKAARAAANLLDQQTLPTQRVLPLTILALVRARRGDPGAENLLDNAAQLAFPTGELQRIGPVAAARAELAWYRGDMEGVYQHAMIGLQVSATQHYVWTKGELCYWQRRAKPTAPVPSDLPEPYALMIAGEWAAAALAWQKLGAPYERALALADGPEDALREALGILEELGAGPLTAIVRQKLRELGARGIPRGPRASTKGNPAGLTRRQVQVLTLLVRGHTNAELAKRLYISAKTVDHHVSSILEKLEVHSRAEAVAAAFGLGILKAAE